MNKRIKILLIASVSGILFSFYLLLRRRGFLTASDIFSLTVITIVLFVFNIVMYNKKNR